MVYGHALIRERLDKELEQYAERITDADRMTWEVGDEFGLDGGNMARQFTINHLRRWSADPDERAIQREYDRQALAMEQRMISGDES